jgi:hypothetical protein
MYDSSFPLIDETDRSILMQKDAHFSGNFAIMLDYYTKEGKGAIDDFPLERIQELYQLEKELGLFLSEEILSIQEKEQVLEAKAKYNSLRDLYDLPPSPAQKVADLILSEDVSAQKEIEALLNLPQAIPLLIQLVEEEDFYNPLFPGYGFAPLHAMECLGKLKAKEAIIPLFESLSKMEFFGQETAIQALVQIGKPGKDFLLSVLKKTPITKDNENAIIALLSFPQDLEIAFVCLDLLSTSEVLKKPVFCSYLLLSFEGLKDPLIQERLLALAKQPGFPIEAQEELQFILRNQAKN